MTNKKHTSSIHSDLGTPEMHKHCKLTIEHVDAEGNVTEAGNGRDRAKNLIQTTLDYLRRHDIISDDQYHAGDRLYWDCYTGGYVPRAVTARLDCVPHSKTNKIFYDLNYGQGDCQKRYFYISKELSKRYAVRPNLDVTQEPGRTGINFWQVTYKICIESITIEALEQWTGWPARSGKKLVGLALDDLHDLYEKIHRRGGALKD